MKPVARGRRHHSASIFFTSLLACLLSASPAAALSTANSAPTSGAVSSAAHITTAHITAAHFTTEQAHTASIRTEATPAPSPTATTTPSPDPTSQPSPDPTAPATPSPDPSETETPVPTETPIPIEPPVDQTPPEVVPLPAIPPSIATSTVSLTSLLIAVAVLATSLLVLWLVLRRRPVASASTVKSALPTRSRGQSASMVLDAMADVGEAMIDSGYPVSMVRSAVHDIAHTNGYPLAEVVVFPTALFVTLDDDGATLTRAVSAGGRPYLLHQVDVIDRVVKVGRVRSASSVWVSRQLAAMRQQPAPFSSGLRVLAYALTSGAIAVLLGGSWLGVLLAAVLGAGVGTLLLLGERLSPSYSALVIVGAALGSSLIVLLVAGASVDPGVLPALVAPLVILLPGGLLTTAVIELATGHIMSGSARVAAGMMRLLLLAVGILSAGALVGVPTIKLDGAGEPLGPFAPWIAVAVFGVGITIYQCARPVSIPWILLVLYVAYGAQVIGDVLFGGVLSALIGAIAMTPVAVLVARHRTGPPAIVSFLPAFWLLVPGALGLVGVTEVLGGEAGAGSTLVATIGTMIAIALGVLIGLAASSSLRDSRLPTLVDFLEPVPEPDRDSPSPGNTKSPS
ncbi:MAG: threonine/serine exporter family protein [Rhodoglobus sp.]